MVGTLSIQSFAKRGEMNSEWLTMTHHMPSRRDYSVKALLVCLSKAKSSTVSSYMANPMYGSVPDAEVL
jgi:hypothetical protein